MRRLGKPYQNAGPKAPPGYDCTQDKTTFVIILCLPSNYTRQELYIMDFSSTKIFNPNILFYKPAIKCGSISKCIYEKRLSQRDCFKWTIWVTSLEIIYQKSSKLCAITLLSSQRSKNTIPHNWTITFRASLPAGEEHFNTKWTWEWEYLLMKNPLFN